MNINYTKQTPIPVVMKGSDIKVGTLFTAHVDGKPPRLWYRTSGAFACLSVVGESYSIGDGAGDSTSFYGYREHKDYEIIVRD